LGFLLVHPLRDATDEGWIRTYARWLFIGLIPSAIMLLVAFWKRILPYGLTEPRLLGILLGIWLLVIAINYTLQQEAGIRRIPVTLAALLLLTLYGPLSVTALSVRSQSRRLAQLVTGAHDGEKTDREVSAALRFLLEHGDQGAVAAAMPGALPSLEWDSVSVSRERRELAAARILTGAGLTYIGEYSNRGERGDRVQLNAQSYRATPTAGYDWTLDVSAWDRTPRLAGADTVSVWFDNSSSIARITVGLDSLTFNLGRLATGLAGKSVLLRNEIPVEELRVEAVTAKRRGALLLQSLGGRRDGDSLRVDTWQGKLLLGRAE
jgi:hypothetical protein